MGDFNGTVGQANDPILQADRILNRKINVDTRGMPIDQAAFKIAVTYVGSYKGAIEKYIDAVNKKHQLIEDGGFYLSQMQQLKVRAESDGLTYMENGMVTFLNRHNIQWDREGNDLRHDTKEWQVNIEYLNNWIKGRSNDVETDVIKLNDIINKQNQLLQSATTIMKKAHSVLESLIKTLN